MPYEVKDIIVSAAWIFHAPIGTTWPADTLPARAAWPTGWVPIGYTLEPTEFGSTFETLDVNVEQQMAPVMSRRTSETGILKTRIAELNVSNMALALAAQAVITPPGVGQPGKEELYYGGDPHIPVRQWGIEGYWNDASGTERPVRVFIWRGQIANGGTFTLGQKDVTGLPLEVRIMADGSKPKGQNFYVIQRITANAL